MKKVKTSELIGPPLDWVVAKCKGIDSYQSSDPDRDSLYEFSPSTDWSQGGPIIEGERITIQAWESFCRGPEKVIFWDAIAFQHFTGPETLLSCEGPTPLIAAMRCYVASKLGKEVDVPEELL